MMNQAQSSNGMSIKSLAQVFRPWHDLKSRGPSQWRSNDSKSGVAKNLSGNFQYVSTRRRQNFFQKEANKLKLHFRFPIGGETIIFWSLEWSK